jgi:hypothetical protein
MKTRRNRSLKRRYSRKYHGETKITKTPRLKTKTGKRWTTAIDAAQKTLTKTRSLEAARTTLKKQALYNARKLFGSITTTM